MKRYFIEKVMKYFEQRKECQDRREVKRLKEGECECELFKFERGFYRFMGMFSLYR